ncbi:MAG: DUF2080 family transposase-associated protein [Actinobacteria bacterium]|nr:DUF2080 family transposase-associated protein [Actinomycetota bacterium]
MSEHRVAPSQVGILNVECLGYEVVEKIAKQCSTSGRILVPKHWVGKKVIAIRIEP